MEIDIRTDDRPYPNEKSAHFTILSRIISTQDSIEVITDNGVRVVRSDSCFSHEIYVARACNELEEEGYLIWEGVAGLIDERGEKHYYLWFEAIEAFPEELWQALQSKGGAEKEEKIDYDDY